LFTTRDGGLGNFFSLRPTLGALENSKKAVAAADYSMQPHGKVHMPIKNLSLFSPTLLLLLKHI